MEEATATRIKDLLPSGDVGMDRRAILGNALYFKGIWDSKFHAKLTRRHQTFYLPVGGKVRLPFMSRFES